MLRHFSEKDFLVSLSKVTPFGDSNFRVHTFRQLTFDFPFLLFMIIILLSNL